MTMTYTPSWEKKSNRWETEPDTWELLDEEIETYNAKVPDEISLEDLLEEEIKLSGIQYKQIESGYERGNYYVIIEK